MRSTSPAARLESAAAAHASQEASLAALIEERTRALYQQEHALLQRLPPPHYHAYAPPPPPPPPPPSHAYHGPLAAPAPARPALLDAEFACFGRAATAAPIDPAHLALYEQAQLELARAESLPGGLKPAPPMPAFVAAAVAAAAPPAGSLASYTRATSLPESAATTTKTVLLDGNGPLATPLPPSVILGSQPKPPASAVRPPPEQPDAVRAIVGAVRAARPAAAPLLSSEVRPTANLTSWEREAELLRSMRLASAAAASYPYPAASDAYAAGRAADYALPTEYVQPPTTTESSASWRPQASVAPPPLTELQAVMRDLDSMWAR